MVGRHADLRRIVHRRVWALANLALVAGGKVEDREEGLPGLASAPMAPLAAPIPEDCGLLEVEVLLAAVRGVVARLAEDLRVHLHARRQLRHAAHVFRPGRRRIEPGDDRRPRRRADRCRRPRVEKPLASLGERVQVRRRGVLVTVGTEMRTVVLAGDPEDARTLRRLTRRRGPKRRDRERRDPERCEEDSEEATNSKLHLPLSSMPAAMRSRNRFCSARRRFCSSRSWLRWVIAST